MCKACSKINPSVPARICFSYFKLFISWVRQNFVQFRVSGKALFHKCDFILNSDDVTGRCCGDQVGTGCGGYVGGKPALDYFREGNHF